jgi:hypothetical protein
VGGEAAAVQWITPAAALDAGRAREIELWLPTAITLAELEEHPAIESVLAARREIRALIPELYAKDGGMWLTVPGGRKYPL